MKLITNRFSAIFSILMMIAIFSSNTLPATAHTQASTQRQEDFFAVVQTQEALDFQSSRCFGNPVGNTTGNGFASSLGAVTASLQDCPNIAVGPPFIFGNGEFTITAGNGDKLLGVYNGQLLPTPTTPQDNAFRVNANFTITGGSGRYEGATGSGQVLGSESLTDLKGRLLFIGTLTTENN